MAVLLRLTSIKAAAMHGHPRMFLHHRACRPGTVVAAGLLQMGSHHALLAAPEEGGQAMGRESMLKDEGVGATS